MDTKKEHIAVGEARKLNIPVVAILDTNCDPDEVDYPIPGNDDAIRSAALLTKVVADAVADGLLARCRRDGGGDGERGEDEPLAEWERELLAGGTARARRPAWRRRSTSRRRSTRRADCRSPTRRGRGHRRGRRGDTTPTSRPERQAASTGRRSTGERDSAIAAAPRPTAGRRHAAGLTRPAGDTTERRRVDKERAPTMANFTAADVKKLRDLTGAGMMDCKKALDESDGDFDKAVEVLRIKGAKDIGKRAERHHRQRPGGRRAAAR